MFLAIGAAIDRRDVERKQNQSDDQSDGNRCSVDLSAKDGTTSTTPLPPGEEELNPVEDSTDMSTSTISDNISSLSEPESIGSLLDQYLALFNSSRREFQSSSRRFASALATLLSHKIDVACSDYLGFTCQLLLPILLVIITTTIACTVARLV